MREGDVCRRAFPALLCPQQDTQVLWCSIPMTCSYCSLAAISPTLAAGRARGEEELVSYCCPLEPGCKLLAGIRERNGCAGVESSTHAAPSRAKGLRFVKASEVPSMPQSILTGDGEQLSHP